ncbi:DNA-3-methyladenine glycosylase 2 family protein [Ktedonosporobacter rubrisoli]|uniref:DNA-3-methyladenine glycosylase II n=1 Tax=Ktedonosporobacter rubrisoli TaxID=2509675 RepID=A0A4P6JX77_KTERU|nr:DNA-3-methyladenine glycosylase [Ktedonosporobacter rubrisoli]QBD79626.1 DNA-3-methyladenine glycosylase 2 family protein [Ktedonosporobacter rubrisoli]
MPATTTQLSTVSGELFPQEPFDFNKTLAFLQAFPPTAGEQALAPATLTKAVSIHGRAVAFKIQATGTIEEPRLTYTLYTEQPLSKHEQQLILERIRFFLSLDDDLRPFYALCLTDLHMAAVIERLYGLHQPKFLTPFEIACWSILVQRTPMAISQRIKQAIVERWGTSIRLLDATYQAFPEADQLAQASSEELLQIVRNERKVAYLRSVIDFFQKTDEQFLRYGNYEEVARQLRKVHGIGAWSAAFILIRGLGRMEASSVEDELLKAVNRIYSPDKPLSQADVQQILQRYGSLQGYYSFYMRVSGLDLSRLPAR